MTQSELKRLLQYDPTTGIFTWIAPSKYHPDLIGKEAGSPIPNRSKIYWVIQINGRKWKRGVLAFLMVNGRLPFPCLDHRNGDSLDDRLFNLRDATTKQNAWNLKRMTRKLNLPMGVRPMQSKFQARITKNGKQYHLGCYDTPAEAQTVYIHKRKELFGEFA